MIAAGSLFTSCVTNTEPQGIKDLREAKADYIESLKNLKDADAAYRKAQVAYEEAKTAWETKQHEIANAIEQAKADATIADKEAEIARIVAQAKIDAVGYEENLAKAEAQLKRTLDSIAVASNKLSDEEREAVAAYTRVYGKYLAAIEDVHAKEAALYDQAISTEEAHLAVVADSARTVAQIAYFEELLKNLPDSGESINQGYELMDQFQAQELELDYAWANCEKEWNLYKSTNLKDNIKGFADGLIDYVAQNAAIPAPFIMNFKTKLPDNEQVCELMQKYVNKLNERFSGIGSFGFINSVRVQNDGKDYWLVANFYNAPAARAAIWGYDIVGDGNDLGSVTSVVQALNRDLVVDSTRWRGIDSTGINAAVAKAEKEYKALEDTLVKGALKYPDVVTCLNKIAETAGTADEADWWRHLYEAREKFYRNVYCKFWGIPYELLNNPEVTEFGFNTEKVRFNNPAADSLEITFSFETFMKEPTIVNFNFEGMAEEAEEDDEPFLPYRDGHFYIYDESESHMVPIDRPFTEIEGYFLKDNFQYFIVIDQMQFNQFWKLKPDYFGYSALSHLLYKESVLAHVEKTADTQGTKEALAALQEEVLPSLEAAYYAALDTQSNNSEAFYKFISGLVGEEFLEELCARIDNACKKASEFIPAIVDPTDIFTRATTVPQYLTLMSELQSVLDYAQLIASGEQPSKKILISIFEDIMCGEFNMINARLLSLFEIIKENPSISAMDLFMRWFNKIREDSEEIDWKMFKVNAAYTIAYMGLQLGDAFAGDQFRAILSEVVTAFVNTRIDRIRSDYPNALTTAAFSKQVLADYDNVIEVVLFGTERYYELYNALFLDKYDYLPSTEKSEFSQIAADIRAQELEFNPVTDIVSSENRFSKLFSKVFLRLCGVVSVKYIVSDFSGVLGDLEETYFTEWREKWEEYDLAMAEFDAKYEALYSAKYVYSQYQFNLEESGLIELEEEYNEELDRLTAHLADVCDFLKKIEAGYDGKTLYFEKVQHELDEALAKLDVITKKLELVTKAYEQVLANHGVEDVPDAE